MNNEHHINYQDLNLDCSDYNLTEEQAKRVYWLVEKVAERAQSDGRIEIRNKIKKDSGIPLELKKEPIIDDFCNIYSIGYGDFWLNISEYSLTVENVDEIKSFIVKTINKAKQLGREQAKERISQALCIPPNSSEMNINLKLDNEIKYGVLVSFSILENSFNNKTSVALVVDAAGHEGGALSFNCAAKLVNEKLKEIGLKRFCLESANFVPVSITNKMVLGIEPAPEGCIFMMNQDD